MYRQHVAGGQGENGVVYHICHRIAVIGHRVVLVAVRLTIILEVIFRLRSNDQRHIVSFNRQ